MSSLQEPIAQSIPAQAAPAPRRGLTLRSFVIAVFALLFMGMWIEYEECFNMHYGAFAENAPPFSAMTVIVVLLVISGLLYLLNRKLRLTPAELVVIYTALLMAAPLMTQGMWHRFFGLLAAVPHNQDFKTYESQPEMLWPHGENLITNGRFTSGADGFTYLGKGALQWDAQATWRGKTWNCPVLDNGGETQARSTLVLTLPRSRDGKEQLRPGDPFLFSLLVKAEGLQKGSFYTVTMQADKGPANTVLLGTADTKKSLALPYGFERQGVCPLNLPRDLREQLTFAITLSGPGKLTVHDLQCFNVRATEGLYSGVGVVREGNLAKLGEGERNNLVIKPDNMFSPAGLRYLVQGFIPLRQWGQTAFAWTVLIGALFLGFFGLNVLLRKQWVENERLSFPQNILPRELFAEEADAQGRPRWAILRNRVVWVGFAFGLVMALLRGWHYYNPAVPVPLPGYSEAIVLANYVSHPLLKVFLQNLNISLFLTLLAITLLVETDVLFSLWACFILFQLMPLFGRMFNFERFPGYPWEFQQANGSFIGYALLALFMARKHLAQVWRTIIGKVKQNEKEEGISYRTAALMVFGALVIIVAWGVWTRMGWLAAFLYFSFVLLCGFTASKVRAEAGPAFAYWFPYYSLYVVMALGGFAVFGVTGMVVVTLCSGFIGPSNFLYLAPVQVESLELGRRFGIRLKDISWGLVIGLFGGLFIGGFALLAWAYGMGADNLAANFYDGYWYFNNYHVPGEVNADRAFLSGTLNSIPENQWWNLNANLNAKGFTIGMGVTWLLALLRNTFTWFPLHPLGYVLATTYFARGLWFVALLAWAIRSIAQRLGGAHGIRRGVVPFAVGMFLGGVVSIIIFDAVSLVMRAQGAIDIYNNVWP